MIADQLRSLRTSRIIGSDENMDYEMENIVFQGTQINPDSVRIDTIVVSPEGASQLVLHNEYSHAMVSIQLSAVTATLQDVKFAFRRKTSQERGLVVVTLAGQGMNIDIELIPCITGETDRLFKVQRVRCESTKIEIRNMRGDDQSGNLFNMFRPVIESRVRRAVEQAIEDCICYTIRMVDQKLIFEEYWCISANAAQQLRDYDQNQLFSKPGPMRSGYGVQSSYGQSGQSKYGQSSQSQSGQSVQLGQGPSGYGQSGQSSYLQSSSLSGHPSQTGQSNFVRSSQPVMISQLSGVTSSQPKVQTTSVQIQPVRDDYPMP